MRKSLVATLLISVFFVATTVQSSNPYHQQYSNPYAATNFGSDSNPSSYSYSSSSTTTNHRTTNPKTPDGYQQVYKDLKGYKISPSSQYNGFKKLQSFNTDPHIIQILKFLQTQFSSERFLYTQLVSVQYKEVPPNQQLYLLDLEIPMDQNPSLWYQLEIEVTDNKAMKITKRHYLNSYEPIYAESPDTINSIPYIEMIDNAIQQIIAQELNTNDIALMMVDSSCPLYILHYSTLEGTVIVTLMLDVLKDEIQIENMQLKSAQTQNLQRQAELLKENRVKPDIEERRRPQRNAQRESIRSNRAIEVGGQGQNQRIVERQLANPQQSIVLVGNEGQVADQPVIGNTLQFGEDQKEIEPDFQSIQIETEDDQSNSNTQISSDNILEQTQPVEIPIPNQFVKPTPQIIRQTGKYDLSSTPQQIQQGIRKGQLPDFASPIRQAIRNIPNYAIDVNPRQLIESLASETDSNLIPFLTEQSKIDSQEAQEILAVITQAVKIQLDSNVRITLINRNRYGIRIVLQVIRKNKERRMFEALLTVAPLQLIHWREITSVEETDPDVFNRFYQIDEECEALRNILADSRLEKRLPQHLLSSSIVKASKKLANDGIYYETLAETLNNGKYKFNFLQLPDSGYLDLIEFYQVDTEYDSSDEKSLNQIPTDNSLFELSFNLIRERFFDQIQNENIVYLGQQHKNDKEYYRFVFKGLNGKNQAITEIDIKSLERSILRWGKLEDGYIELNRQNFQQLPGYTKFSEDVNRYIEKFVDVNKIGRIPRYQNVEVRRMPEIGSNFKLFYEEPFPFILNVEQRKQRGNQIIGMERIKIVPHNKYYNDIDFAGYKQINQNRLRTSSRFHSLLEIIIKQYPEYSWAQVQIEAGFKLSKKTEIIYKIVLKSKAELYLATAIHSVATQKTKIDSVVEYSVKTQPGNYRWKCDKTNEQGSYCEKCSDSYALTYGKCYERVRGCDLQSGVSCYSCEQGYIRNNQRCYQSFKKTPTLPRKPVNERVITSIQPQEQDKKSRQQKGKGDKQKYLPEPSRYSQSNDKCIKYKGQICSKCANRYFLAFGRCERVQDSCSHYEQTGKCNKCYSGFYRTEYGECMKADPLCLDSNSKGNCVACYKNYILKKGKCYYKTPFQNEHYVDYDDNNQLCEIWSKDGHCLKCLGSTYFNKKTNKCQIKDPFCQIFNEDVGICEICQRGYKSQKGKCERINRYH